MSDYIKLFNTKSEQDAFLSSSGYKEPHISCTANGGNLRYNQSFDVTNGLISNIETDPEIEEVMPHDGMDPDAGGGEDIVEEEPTDSPEEEAEEEP